MTNFIRAFSVSLFVHAALAAILALTIEFSPKNCTEAMLDLSSVELSLSKQERESPPRPAEPSNDADAGRMRPEVKKLSAPEIEKMEAAINIATPPKEESSELDPAEEIQVETPSVPKETSLPAPDQARVDAPPKLKEAIRPKYPEAARRRGAEGSVTLEVMVDESGRAGAVKIVRSSGFGELDSAAVKAVRGARFQPARTRRGAVSQAVSLTLIFKLK